MGEISQNINTVINILKLIPPIKSKSAAFHQKKPNSRAEALHRTNRDIKYNIY